MRRFAVPIVVILIVLVAIGVVRTRRINEIPPVPAIPSSEISEILAREAGIPSHPDGLEPFLAAVDRFRRVCQDVRLELNTELDVDLQERPGFGWLIYTDLDAEPGQVEYARRVMETMATSDGGNLFSEAADADGLDFGQFEDFNDARDAVPLSELRTLGRLVRTRAALDADNPELAVNAIGQSLMIGRITSCHANLMGYILGAAEHAKAMQLVRDALPLVRHDAPLLNKIEQQLRRHDLVPLDVCFRLSSRFLPRDEYKSFDPVSLRITDHSDDVRIRMKDDMFDLANTFNFDDDEPPKNRSFLLGDYVETNDMMVSLLADAVALPVVERAPLIEKAEAIGNRGPWPCHNVGGAYAKMLENHDAHLAQHGGLLLVVAIERYRYANDRLPKTLTDLVPDWIDQLPEDPYTGASYVYRLTTDADTHPTLEGLEYLVYSTGADREDNGGTVQRNDHDTHRDVWHQRGLDFIVNVAPARLEEFREQERRERWGE